MVQQLYKEQRRDLIVVNFLRARGRSLLDEIRAGIRQEKLLEPFADMNDDALQAWLMSIDGVESRIGCQNSREFFVKPQSPGNFIRRRPIRNSSPMEPASYKRKNPSPVMSPPAKRSAVPPPTRPSALSVLLTAADGVNRKEPSAGCRNMNEPMAKKITSRPSAPTRHWQAYKTDVPNLYSAMLIGDENFLNLAVFDLKFEVNRKRGFRQSGGCASGLKIADATRFVMNLEPGRVKRAIINVGSVDIAEGRPLVRMIKEYCELVQVCVDKSIAPILTTLAPLPNCLHNEKKRILSGFNDFIRTYLTNFFPVIDLYKGMTYSDGRVNWNLYQSHARSVGGSKKAFVLWNRAGRQHVHNILEDGLGFTMIPGAERIRNNFRHFAGSLF